VLLDGDRVAAVDWEGAWRDGIPGLDLLYLALFARSDEPDFRALDEPGDVRPALAQLGVTEDVLPATLLVVLATWALSERRRRARLGSPPPPSVFERELERRAAALG
jgi:hypothetical protein